MANRRVQRRLWCFTENVNARAFYTGLGELFDAMGGHARYLCGQLELADTGQEHFQGYLQLTRSRAHAWVRRNLSNTAHIEVQRGTNIQARNYCQKVASRILPFIEQGEFSHGQGMRGDLISFRDAIRNGVTQTTLIEELPCVMARYPRFYSMVRALYPPERKVDLKVILNYGSTGTGKTRFAYDNYPMLFALPLSSTSMWFDGYDMHKVVLLDDFAGRSSKVSLNYTLRLLDRYAVQVPVKGGYSWWLPELIIITTNVHPNDWYDWQGREHQYEALLRRIHEVWIYTIGDKECLDDDEERELFDRKAQRFNYI